MQATSICCWQHAVLADLQRPNVTRACQGGTLGDTGYLCDRHYSLFHQENSLLSSPHFEAGCMRGMATDHRWTRYLVVVVV